MMAQWEIQEHLDRIKGRNPNGYCRVRISTAVKRAETAVELWEQLKRVSMLHTESYFGRCEQDDEDWPCATRQALNGEPER